jgi:hypothetical protein
MTYQEAKDQVARNYGYIGFRYIIDLQAQEISDKAAELYAKSKWEESTDSNRKETERVFDKAGGTLSANYFFRNVKRPEFK